MRLNEFQQLTESTAVYPDKGTGSNKAVNYCVVGLCGEAGEVANKWKKSLRGDGFSAEELQKELEDTLWYVARTLDELGVPLETAARQLLNRLKNRKDRGVIKGSGDNR
jgi:NTP pyrophosphatase (non-canonical NTP hydrolase)